MEFMCRRRQRRHMKNLTFTSENQPYEKFLQFGPQGLTDTELIAIILRTGTKEKSAVQLAEEITHLGKNTNDGILSLYSLSLNDLMAVKGVGQVKAVKLKALTELSMRFSKASAKERLCFKKPVSVAKYFMETLRHRDTETVILVCLDAKGHLISEKEISKGSVRMSLISPREIFIEALAEKAVNIILLHNHPSGDPTPSDSDISLTLAVKEFGEKIDIILLDHIIIGDNKYYSFRDTQKI